MVRHDADESVRYHTENARLKLKKNVNNMRRVRLISEWLYVRIPSDSTLR